MPRMDEGVAESSKYRRSVGREIADGREEAKLVRLGGSEDAILSVVMERGVEMGSVDERRGCDFFGRIGCVVAV